MKADTRRPRSQGKLLAEIQVFLEREVQPVLGQHFGGITIVGLQDGVLQFRLTGSCAGCSSAWLTAEEVVRAPLLKQFPQLRDVVAEREDDEALLQLARDALAGKYPSE